ncbi:MAG: hypothetical protein HQM08_29705 [Candidatus Riflebacteria bacterium]|nr:hypothetical protein [Candidatus Riflebacteria bacterium]
MVRILGRRISRKGFVMVLAALLTAVGMPAIIGLTTDVGWSYYQNLKLNSAVNAAWKAGQDEYQRLLWNVIPPATDLNASQTSLLKNYIFTVFKSNLPASDAASWSVTLNGDSSSVSPFTLNINLSSATSSTQGNVVLQARSQYDLFFMRMLNIQNSQVYASRGDHVYSNGSSDSYSASQTFPIPLGIPFGVTQDFGASYTCATFPWDPTNYATSTPTGTAVGTAFKVGNEYILKLGTYTPIAHTVSWGSDTYLGAPMKILVPMVPQNGNADNITTNNGDQCGQSSDNAYIKAYGVAYWCLKIDGNDSAPFLPVEWLLGFKGGAFLLPFGDAGTSISSQCAKGAILAKQLTTRSINFRIIVQATSSAVINQTICDELGKQGIATNSNIQVTMYSKALQDIYDAVGTHTLELDGASGYRFPVGVYSSQPDPDPVELVLQAAEIPYGNYHPGRFETYNSALCNQIFDNDVINGALDNYTWLHMHHEDFTGFCGGCDNLNNTCQDFSTFLSANSSSTSQFCPACTQYYFLSPVGWTSPKSFTLDPTHGTVNLPLTVTTSTHTATSAITGTNTATQTSTGTQTARNSSTSTCTSTYSGNGIGTVTESCTGTGTKTGTGSVTGTKTGTCSANGTQTGTCSANGTQTGTCSANGTKTATGSANGTGTSHQTQTYTSGTQTRTRTDTYTQTQALTSTVSQTQTQTCTVSQTQTQTCTVSQTQTQTCTVSQTQTQTCTVSQTQTQTRTNTQTDTITQTDTNSDTFTKTQTTTVTGTNATTCTSTNSCTQTYTDTQSCTAVNYTSSTTTSTCVKVSTPCSVSIGRSIVAKSGNYYFGNDSIPLSTPSIKMGTWTMNIDFPMYCQISTPTTNCTRFTFQANLPDGSTPICMNYGLRCADRQIGSSNWYNNAKKGIDAYGTWYLDYFQTNPNGVPSTPICNTSTSGSMACKSYPRCQLARTMWNTATNNGFVDDFYNWSTAGNFTNSTYSFMLTRKFLISGAIPNDSSSLAMPDDSDIVKYPSRVSKMKFALARLIRNHVAKGGFLYAQCFAPETLDMTLWQAREYENLRGTNADSTIRPASYTPPTGNTYAECFAFTGFNNAEFCAYYSTMHYSTINTKQSASFNLSDNFDPRCQNHTSPCSGNSGYTASFDSSKVKSTVKILGTDSSGYVGYLSGDVNGKGAFCFLGGHFLPDIQTERLVLNNLLLGAVTSKTVAGWAGGGGGNTSTITGKVKYNFGVIDPDNTVTSGANASSTDEDPDYQSRLANGGASATAQPIQADYRMLTDPGNYATQTNQTIWSLTHDASGNCLTKRKLTSSDGVSPYVPPFGDLYGANPGARVAVPITDIPPSMQTGINATASTIYDLQSRDNPGGAYTSSQYNFTASPRIIGFAEFELIATDTYIRADSTRTEALDDPYSYLGPILDGQIRGIFIRYIQVPGANPLSQ